MGGEGGGGLMVTNGISSRWTLNGLKVKSW